MIDAAPILNTILEGVDHDREEVLLQARRWGLIGCPATPLMPKATIRLLMEKVILPLTSPADHATLRYRTSVMSFKAAVSAPSTPRRTP